MKFKLWQFRSLFTFLNIFQHPALISLCNCFKVMVAQIILAACVTTLDFLPPDHVPFVDYTLHLKTHIHSIFTLHTEAKHKHPYTCKHPQPCVAIHQTVTHTPPSPPPLLPTHIYLTFPAFFLASFLQTVIHHFCKIQRFQQEYCSNTGKKIFVKKSFRFNSMVMQMKEKKINQKI